MLVSHDIEMFVREVDVGWKVHPRLLRKGKSTYDLPIDSGRKIWPTCALRMRVTRRTVDPPPATPEEQLAAPVEAMEAGMIAVRSQDVRIIGNGNHIISFLEPERPRIVEWQGDGRRGRANEEALPIFCIVRFSAFDDFKEDR
ncbi:hypothetical protein J4T87_0028355 (plasmid) [Rhizobium sp. T1473]|uniref:hypothetical protein n=2 Tax=unclassified Rhizobium TaxID=2613769 RepID=UPI001AC2C920|nr:hypothetical protein [Rhizobium sp. T1473]